MFQKIMQMPGKAMQIPGKAAAKKKILNQDESHAFAHNIIIRWKKFLTSLHEAILENERGWVKIWASYSALHSAVDMLYAKEDAGVRSTTAKLQEDSVLVQNNASHDAPKALGDAKRELSMLLNRVRKAEAMQSERLDVARQFKHFQKKANEAAQKGAHDRIAKNRKAAADTGDRLNRATEDLYTELESIDNERLAIADRAVRAILEMQTFVFTSNPVGNAMKMATDVAIGNRSIPQDTTIDWDTYKPGNVCSPGQSGSLAPYPAAQQPYPYGATPPYHPQAHYPQQYPYQSPTAPSSQPPSQPYLPQAPFHEAPSPIPGPYIPSSAAPPQQQYHPSPSGHSTPPPPSQTPPPPPPSQTPPPPPSQTPPPPPSHTPPPPPPPGNPPPHLHGHPPPPPPGHPPQVGVPAPSPPGFPGGSSPAQNQSGHPATFPGNQPPGPGAKHNLYQSSAPIAASSGPSPAQPLQPGFSPPRPGDIRPSKTPGAQFLPHQVNRPPAHQEFHQSPSPGNSNPALAGGHAPPIGIGNPFDRPGGPIPNLSDGRPSEFQGGNSSPVEGLAPSSSGSGHSGPGPNVTPPTQAGHLYVPPGPFKIKHGLNVGHGPGNQGLQSSSSYGGSKPVSQQASEGYTSPPTGGHPAGQAGLPGLSQSLTASVSGQVTAVDGNENNAGGSGPLPSDMEFLSGYAPPKMPEGKTPSLGPRPPSSHGPFDDASSFDEQQNVQVAKIDVGGGTSPSSLGSSHKMDDVAFSAGIQYLPPEVQFSRPPQAAGAVGPSQNLAVPPGYPVVEQAGNVGVNQGNDGAVPIGAVCHLPKPPSLYPGNSAHSVSGGMNQWPNASQGNLDPGVGAKIQYNRSGSSGSSSVSGGNLSHQLSELDIYK